MKITNTIAFVTMILLSAMVYSQTSWTGTQNTNWNTANNWSNGKPEHDTEVIIGDAYFTGPYQPYMRQNISIGSLTIGTGAKTVEVRIRRNVIITGDIIIGSQGSLTQENGSSLTLQGNWTNQGNYTGEGSNSQVIFSGAAQQITGVTTFRSLTINTGSTVTLNNNISAENEVIVSGTLNPAAHQLAGAGTVNVHVGGTLMVMASTFGENYSMTTTELHGQSIVDYASSLIPQTVSNALTYGWLRISGGTLKTLSGNLPALQSGQYGAGRILVDQGTLDLQGYTANRGTSSAGGAFIVAGGATLKIGGSSSFPTNYAQVNLAPASLVEYNGGTQTVSSLMYGHLRLSSSSGEALKGMAAAPLVVAGDFTMEPGLGTAVVFTASANVTVNRNVLLGTGSELRGATHTHTFRGHFTNQGIFTGNTSQAIFSGLNALITGAGTFDFHSMLIEGSGIVAEAISQIGISGNLSTTGSGTFTHAPGGVITMTGSSKTISGSGLKVYDMIISGSISTTSAMRIGGDFHTTGSFTANGGTLDFTGSTKTISGSGSINFFALVIGGTINITTDISIASNLSVDPAATLSATSGNTSFNGSSFLSGEARLMDVTITTAKTLAMGAGAILGIGSAFNPSGSFQANTSVPNTVVYYAAGAQNVAATSYNNLILNGSGIKAAAGNVTISRDFVIETGVEFHAGSFTHTLHRHLLNQGTFEANTSTFILGGTPMSDINGQTTFHHLKVDKLAHSTRVSLLASISALTLEMATGNMHTGEHAVTITQDRTGDGIIMGTIIRNHGFAHGIDYPFEGPQNVITFSTPVDINSVTVIVTQGDILDFIPGKESVTREYEILIPGGSYAAASLKLHYEDNELNAFMENFLALYRHVEATTWDSIGVTTRDAALNSVTMTALPVPLQGRWAMSGVRNLVRWNGSVSTAWEDPLNWTTLSGVDLSNRVPATTDAVQIGHAAFTHHPHIASNPEVNSLQFGSAIASTLTLGVGNTLTTLGTLSGVWTAPQIHNLDVGNSALNVGTNLILSDAGIGNGINLMITNGSVAVENNIIQNGAGAITFSGTGQLSVNQNYIYQQGSFVPGSGTVVYAGANHQQVAPLDYNHLTFDKTSGEAFITQPVMVLGNLTLMTGGGLEVSDSLEVTGDIRIGANTSMNHNTSIHICLMGNWLNEGLFQMNNGMLHLMGTGNQLISPSGFNNLVIEKPSGTVTLTGNITLNSNLSLLQGTLDLQTFTVNRTNPGGVLEMGPATHLIIGGIHSIPEFFNTFLLDVSSTVEYSGSMSQHIHNMKYGNLKLSNGGELNAKLLHGNIDVYGNLEITNGAGFNADNWSLNLWGNLDNQGVMLPSAGTLLLRGAEKNLHGNITINNLEVLGSYTSTGETVLIHGNLLIAPAASMKFSATTVSLDGDLTNRGFLSSNGIATFTGIRLQTIQLENPVDAATSSTGQIIFDGSVSPILNSSSQPQFATVHIKNTGGVRASVPWNVALAMIIHPGATFEGGPHRHTFNGHFTNNGNLTSSGIMNFAPQYFPSTITLDNGGSFASTGTVIFGGIQPLTIVGNTSEFNKVVINSTNAAGISPQKSWTIVTNLYVESGSVLNGGEGLSHDIQGSFTNNGTYEGQGSTVRFIGNPSEMEGAGSTRFNNLTIGALADFYLRTTVHVEKDFLMESTGFNTLGNGVIFSGSMASTINSTAGPVTFSTLGAQKSEAVGIHLMVPANVSDDLLLEAGILFSSEENILTLFNEAYSTSGNPLSYVEGPMIKQGNQDFVFPLGKDGVWARIGISAPILPEASFKAQYFAIPYADTQTVDYPVHNVSLTEYWVLDRVATTDNVAVTLFWEDRLRSGINNLNDLLVVRWDGTQWVDEKKDGGGVSATIDQGFVFSSAVTSFSPFTFGSSEGANPLPVEFLQFGAEYHEPVVLLQWSTASEVNNDYFSIERSTDGSHFQLLGTVQGSGTTSVTNHYNATDPSPFQGISYYRVKQTDFDGSFKYTQKVAVQTGGTSRESIVRVYPNPGQSHNINIGIANMGSGNVELLLFNASGVNVFSTTHTIDDSHALNLRLSPQQSLAPGHYYLHVKGERYFGVKKVVIH